MFCHAEGQAAALNGGPQLRSLLGRGELPSRGKLLPLRRPRVALRVPAAVPHQSKLLDHIDAIAARYTAYNSVSQNIWSARSFIPASTTVFQALASIAVFWVLQMFESTP
jgi:hypothetical protein